MKSASERDQEFTEFVRDRRAALVRLAVLLMSGDRAGAEDAVQTALTRETPYVDTTAIVALLATLPARMRAAIVLRYIEGLNSAETAQALRCSEGTVRSQCARGLERLRANLPAHSRSFV